MRLTAWNCRSATARKIPALEALHPDVAVIGEACMENPRPEATLTEPALQWFSKGRLNYKALAIAGFDQTVSPLPDRHGQGDLTVAVSVPDGPIVIGMWSSPSAGGGNAYQVEVLKTLHAWREELESGKAILMGDLNIGHAIGREVKNSWIADAQEAWNAMGLTSAYHAFTGEAIGSETQATLFHTTKREEAWHIDFALIAEERMEQVQDVRLGDYANWVEAGWSDHVPLTVDVDWA